VSADAFSTLGLAPDASAAEVNHARRRLAREHHPDVGGSAARMRAINEAAAIALKSLEPNVSPRSDEFQRDPSASKLIADWDGQFSDVASFTVEVLPAQAFEGLLVAAARIGEVIDDDPPYRLEAILGDPILCWCQLDVVPDAGASTVSLTIGLAEGRTSVSDLPNIEQVRDAWVETLNELDWT
jgi:hypothetical protein